MAFEPKNETHAIVESVWLLNFAREFTGDEIEALAKNNILTDFLPHISKPQIFHITFGSEAEPQPPAGLQMQRFKEDGLLAWRLRVSHSEISVNCLDYKGWKVSGDQAGQLILAAISSSLLQEDNHIVSCLKQVANLFTWNGPRDVYDASELFFDDNKILPPCVRGKGEAWHSHCGWFEPVEGGDCGIEKMLRRVNVDALVEDNIPTLRFDVLSQAFLLESIGPSPAHQSEVEEIFNFLHDANKDMVRNQLSTSMRKRIGINE